MKYSNVFALSQCVLLVACIVAFSGPCMAGAGGGTTVVQTTNTDTQAKTGNGEYGSSYLKSKDSVTIEAPEVTSPTTGLGMYGVCRGVVSNDPAKDIFVPWGSRIEWSAFLKEVGSGALASYSVASCCTPATAVVCGVDSNTPLGRRILGTVLDSKAKTGKPRDSDLLNQLKTNTDYLNEYGAPGDVYGPVLATQVTGDTTIDYEVTYVCNGGSWTKTHEKGSCVPIDGACASPGYLTTFPTGDAVQALCGAGSIFQNLTTTPSGWKWECAGTPGMQTAECQAYNSAPINGVCGPAAGAMTYTDAQMGTVPSSQLCSVGTATGAPTNGNVWGNDIYPNWSWQCAGLNGGVGANCTALSPVNSGCGGDNGRIFGPSESPLIDLASNPLTLCGGFLAGNVTAADVSYDSTANTWTWTCHGVNGGTGATCGANYNAGAQAGGCGPDFDGHFASLLDGDPGLCSDGTPSVVAVSSLYPSDSRYWQWSCGGLEGGATAWCWAYLANPADAVCGPDNLKQFLPGTLSNSDPGLCATGLLNAGGVSTDATNHSTYWYWICLGVNGGAEAWCNAGDGSGALVNGACGAAAGVPSMTAPAATSLCSQGIWTAVNPNSDDTAWQWSCMGANGGTTAPCTAPIPVTFANGVCGATNGTSIPNSPNFNMCNSGLTGPVSGVGPWTWTCLGTAGGTNSPQCEAYLCNACTGSITAPKTGNLQTSTGACTASGTTAWTETDALIPGAASSGTISWIDDIGGFSQTVPYTSATGYCAPCYTQIQSASNVQITVTKASAGCPFSKGDVLPPSGVVVTVP